MIKSIVATSLAAVFALSSAGMQEAAAGGRLTVSNTSQQPIAYTTQWLDAWDWVKSPTESKRPVADGWAAIGTTTPSTKDVDGYRTTAISNCKTQSQGYNNSQGYFYWTDKPNNYWYKFTDLGHPTLRTRCW